MSKIEVDKLDPQSGTALEIGTSGDTVTVPSGVGLTLTDSTLLLPTTITSTTEVKTNKISPATGVAFALGDSGDTFTVPSGATITNNGTATGFGGGKVLQVVQDTLATEFNTSSSSFVEVTGLTVDITPSATSSKVLILLHGCMYANSGSGYNYVPTIYRNQTTNLGDSSNGFGSMRTGSSTMGSFVALSYLDSPSTTSATTYSYYFKISAGTGYMSYNTNSVSTIQVLEIGA